MKTWHVEMAVVGAILMAVTLATRGGLVGLVGTLGVLCAFGHTSITQRFVERETVRSKPSVECHRWTLAYFVGKEIFFGSYFLMHKSYEALVGVGVFLAYPAWRRWWRGRYPLEAEAHGG